MTREEAIKHLSEWMDEKMWRCFGTIDREAIGMAIEALQIPIIKRPKGEWQKVDEQPYFRKHFDNVCCSVCHHKGMRKYNYCPNCGADMKGKEE